MVTPEVLEAALAEPNAASGTEADLAPRVQQALVEREALDKLVEALSQVSAGQAAADAIERGDFAARASRSSTLGEEADQLSDAAKRRLCASAARRPPAQPPAIDSWPIASGRRRKR